MNNCINIKVMYTNVDQFLNKRDELIKFIVNDEPNIIMIAEVIPKAQVYSIEAVSLELPGYSFHPNFESSDSNLDVSGIRGVAIYVKEDLNADIVWSPCSMTIYG